MLGRTAGTRQNGRDPAEKNGGAGALGLPVQKWVTPGRWPAWLLKRGPGNQDLPVS
jgi:hypothetical protein